MDEVRAVERACRGLSRAHGRTGEVERMRREDAAYGSKLAVAVGFPLCVYLAHLLQRLT